MSAQRERAAPRPRPAWIMWGGPVLVLLALAMAGAGALRAPAGVVDGSQNASVAALLRALAPGSLLSPEARFLLKEVGKQAIEQPLHVLMAAAPICLSRQLTRVPWYGWAITPLLVWREWTQWPSERWWDPPLDWAFLTLGVALATWRRSRRRPPQPSPRPPSHPLRRKYASRPPATASISARANG
jgi:hypothetical protein